MYARLADRLPNSMIATFPRSFAVSAAETVRRERGPHVTRGVVVAVQADSCLPDLRRSLGPPVAGCSAACGDRNNSKSVLGFFFFSTFSNRSADRSSRSDDAHTTWSQTLRGRRPPTSESHKSHRPYYYNVAPGHGSNGHCPSASRVFRPV